MADKTIFQLNFGDSPQLTDVTITGQDPSGTPSLVKHTWQTILNFFTSNQLASGANIITGTSDALFASPKALRDAGVVDYEVIGGVIYHKIYIGATAWQPTITSGCASLAQLEMGTNKNVYDYLAFDKDTIEYAYCGFGLPFEYTGGTVLAKFLWTHPATTTNFKVSWGLQGVCIADGENLDVAHGTAQYANDTGGSTSYLYVSPLTSAITIAGTPAAGKMLRLRVLRKADDATNDTLAVNAYLLGVMLYIPVV